MSNKKENKYILERDFQKTPTLNGRIYSKEIYEKALNDYLIKEKNRIKTELRTKKLNKILNNKILNNES